MRLPAPELKAAVRRTLRAIDPTLILAEEISADEVMFTVDKRGIVAALRALAAEPALSLNMLSTITAIDHLLLARRPRFDVVYQLYSLEHGHRLRLKAPVEADEPAIDSVCELWSGANFMEREVYDMFGIEFPGHPNLERILMPENWQGHPLRKDFPIGGSPSFYYKHATGEYTGEPDDLVPRIRVQEGDI